MIAEFRISNFLSFDKMTEFSMLASSDKTRLSDNTFSLDKYTFLKSAAIYGANGSGKSNFISAFSYMRSLVLGIENLDDRSFKLNDSLNGKPSYFEIIFYDKDNKRFRYGFEANKDRVLSEWLFRTPTSRESMLFTREGDDVNYSRTFIEAKAIKSKSKKKSLLFLSEIAKSDGKISKSVVDWFEKVNVMSGIDTNNNDTLKLLAKKDKKCKAQVLDILHSFDVQIEDFIIKERTHKPTEFPADAKVPESLKKLMKVLDDIYEEEKIKPTPQVVTIRRTYDDSGKPAGVEQFDLLDNESDGIKKLFSIAGYLVEALESGRTLVIDELEAKLHPLITKEIVNIFNSKERNSNNAQLIFTTHDTNLLTGGHLRRDQIWFTEKDQFGGSHLYSLAEYKEKPRKDAPFEKDYINGRYGAIPFIGDFSELIKSRG